MSARGEAATSADPFRRGGLATRALPFVVPFLLAYALLPVEAGVRWGAAAIAAGVAVLIVVLVPATPWGRLPRDAMLVVPFLAVVEIAFLRDAAEPARSGYATLFIVPVLGAALYASVRNTMLVVAAVGLAVILPILVVGGPRYHDTEWRRAVILMVIAGVAGLVVQRLVTEVRRRAADAARRERFLRTVMDSAAEGICTVDAAGRATYANPAAARMLGWDADELLGRDLHATVHHTRPDGTPYPAAECAMAQRRVAHVDDEVFWRRDGTSFPVEYRSTPLREGAEGKVVTFDDISRRREVDRLKDEFVSMVGHELRTPLTSIRGSLGLITGGVFGPIPPEPARMLDIATTNTDRLVRLINDILDFERMRSGRMAMERRVCDAAELAAQAESVVRAGADEAGVGLVVDVPHARLFADADRIVQALTNLLGNAVKFSPSGGQVRLTGKVGRGELRLEVRDEGRGIPADHLEAIFDRFTQVDSSDARDKGGTGLGLPISRSIAHQHGGRLWADSRPGEGATFVLALPLLDEASHERPLVLLAVPQADAYEELADPLRDAGYAVRLVTSAGELRDAARDTPPSVVAVDLRVDGAEEAVEALPGCPVVVVGEAMDEVALRRALRTARLEQGRSDVLVVEDDADLASVLRSTIEGLGASARRAASAEEAIALMRAQPPDLLLLDLILPGAQGEAVVDWMRGHPDLPPIPIVVYTARELAEIDRDRLSLGDTEFFLKGEVPPQVVEQRLAELLGRLAGAAPAA